MPSSAAAVLRRMIEMMDLAEWEKLASVLGPDFRAEYAHTHEVFDREAFVALNRDYPGRWRLEVRRLVAEGDTAVSHATVTDAAGGPETHHVVSFATVRDGLVAELYEVWAEETQPEPERRPSPT